MIDRLTIEPFLNLVDLNNIRVHQPTSVFLICGGELQIDTSKAAPSLREAYMRVCINPPLSKYQSVLAEELLNLFSSGSYQDFLRFEADIAEVSRLVLLFSESYGSAAELGAFSISTSISDKLLVIIDDSRYIEKSFIRYGPIMYLQRAHGDASVCVINRADIGVADISRLENLDYKNFFNIMSESINERILKTEESSRFDSSKRGHIIKLLVGLTQWYGALTIDEIEICLMYFDFNYNRSDIVNFLLCAQLLGWVVKDQRGLRTFFAASAEKMAVQFFEREGDPKLNRLRWQAQVREQWKNIDPLRFNCICSASAGGYRG